MQVLPYWKIIVEISILWYVIYMSFLFVKGTRSEQLLKGLLVLGAIFFVTQQLGLYAISWVLTRLIPISIIALVVIFQPELRRGLAQLGQLGMHQTNVELIEEIAGAAANLSRRKIGALIVIEREVGLKSYVESGTPIDAKVTNYLLTSIFIPQSPLHDGAVVIQQGRLVAAGCVLPLPEEEKTFPKALGMRHRAAVGISEETDAVCVVVSEETGAVSVAHAGKLTHGLDEEALVRTLKNLFYRAEKRKNPFNIKTSLLKRGKNKEE
ncbi:MAG: diadenylate cyclase CdaA [Candidatus Omnitrophica bacterium]|nr:diadenylate cyclase CdaA [Candidatus Omnitrophota bacterium]